jgi:hypothetical protein
MYLFILLLTSGKFFIGSFMNSNEIVLNNTFIKNVTNNFNWVSFDLPTKIIEIIDIKNIIEIDIKTKEYMVEHGIDNVRGGSYSSYQLEDYQKKSLNDELSKLILQKKQHTVSSFESIDKQFDGKNFEEKLSIITTDSIHASIISKFISKCNKNRNQFYNNRGRWTGEKMNELEKEKEKETESNFFENLINDDYDKFINRNICPPIQQNQNIIRETFGLIANNKEQKILNMGPDSNSINKYMFNRIQQTIKHLIDRYGSIEKITEYYDYIFNNFTENKENKIDLNYISF